MKYPLGLALINVALLRETGRKSTVPAVRLACQRAAYEQSRIAEMEMRKVRLEAQQ